MKRTFPSDCRITGIKHGVGMHRKDTLYACLVDGNGVLLIAATMDYIVEQLRNAEFIRVEPARFTEPVMGV